MATFFTIEPVLHTIILKRKSDGLYFIEYSGKEIHSGYYTELLDKLSLQPLTVIQAYKYSAFRANWPYIKEFLEDI